MRKVDERNQSSPLIPLCSIMYLLCLIIFFHQKSLRDLGCKISQVRIRQKAMGVEEGTKELRSLKWNKAEMHEQTTLAWLFNNNQEIAIKSLYRLGEKSLNISQ